MVCDRPTDRPTKSDEMVVFLLSTTSFLCFCSVHLCFYGLKMLIEHKQRSDDPSHFATFCVYSCLEASGVDSLDYKQTIIIVPSQPWLTQLP